MQPTRYEIHDSRSFGVDGAVVIEFPYGGAPKELAWFRNRGEAEAYLSALNAALDFAGLVESGIELVDAQRMAV